MLQPLRLCSKLYSNNLAWIPTAIPGCSTTIRTISDYKPKRPLPIDFLNNLKLRFLKYKVAIRMANNYQPERVMVMGPDFACLEWLMNAGATSVLLSNEMKICSQNEMRKFLADQGFDVYNLKTEAPEARIMKDFDSKWHFKSSLESEIAYNERWRHISPIYLKEIDATDAVISDHGAKYFLECRHIEKLVLNFCDYFGDEGLRILSEGRPARTLQDLEICFTSMVTERSSTALIKFKALQRLHMFFLPMVGRRTAMLRHLKTSLHKCTITFPEPYFIGLGYETEEERVAFKRMQTQNANFIQKWMQDRNNQIGVFFKRFRKKGD